jgi:Fur family transcriptional regulator, zinc uptake regulator
MQTAKNHSNEGDVLKVLNRSRAPMSAYDILDALRVKGASIKAPTQVYRALERLMKEGEVHRIAALNAFVRCSCAHKGSAAGFIVCTDCGTVKEFDAGPETMPKPAPKGFSVSPASYEISGTCQNCQKAGGR